MKWHEQAEAKWDSFARNWASNSREMWETGSRKDIMPFLSKHVAKGSRVCDLGCGDGYGSMKLLSQGYRAVGLDLSNEMIETAKSRLQGEDVRFIQGDIAELPFANGEFDAIMAINSIEWTENPLEALHEMKRVVREGGLACLGILGPTAGPRKAHSFHRLYGEKVIMNSMLPWEFERIAVENGWKLIDEFWVEKKEAKRHIMPPMPKELQQSVSFMWLFMLQKEA
ncbi:MAG: class I SAM-dependent methyltransferase [Bacillus sp. (in: firmicutes)]